jgi:transcription initiation factor IIF auxiliary subunit
MSIDLYTSEKGGKQSFKHDLNFQKNEYESDHEIKFRNPSKDLISSLRETGPIPGDENGTRKKIDTEKRRKKAAGSVDMERLADLLVKLQEDELLHVVQMIHDNKSSDTYTKNDADRKSFSSFWDSYTHSSADGEFHVDLYTLPDPLLKMLWEYVSNSTRA